MPDERLPYGKQISPNQINLYQALQLVRDIADKDLLYQAIGESFFAGRDHRNRKISGMNCFLAMRSYGLITDGEDYKLTDLADELLAKDTKQSFNERFARHILLNLHGMQVVEAVDSLQARGVKVRVESVVEELTALGIGSGGDSGEDLNPLRLWLERGGCVR